MRRGSSEVGLAIVGATIALALASCGPVTPTSKVRDAAQTMVTQLPNSSNPESAAAWLDAFSKKGQTGTGEGNIVGPTWHDGPFADFGIGGGSAYSATTAHSRVILDIAIMRVGPGEAGLSGKPDSAFMCVEVSLSPGRSADMTDTSCPTDVRDRASAKAQYTEMVTLGGDLHADATH
jgi:hypothetical protein